MGKNILQHVYELNSNFNIRGPMDQSEMVSLGPEPDLYRTAESKRVLVLETKGPVPGRSDSQQASLLSACETQMNPSNFTNQKKSTNSSNTGVQMVWGQVPIQEQGFFCPQLEKGAAGCSGLSDGTK